MVTLVVRLNWKYPTVQHSTVLYWHSRRTDGCAASRTKSIELWKLTRCIAGSIYLTAHFRNQNLFISMESAQSTDSLVEAKYICLNSDGLGMLHTKCFLHRPKAIFVTILNRQSCPLYAAISSVATTLVTPWRTSGRDCRLRLSPWKDKWLHQLKRSSCTEFEDAVTFAPWTTANCFDSCWPNWRKLSY